MLRLILSCVNAEFVCIVLNFQRSGFCTRALIKNLNEYFQTEVEIPRIWVGKKHEIETLINEEAMLLGMYLRGEKKDWIPRIVKPQ